MASRCSRSAPIWGPEMTHALPTGRKGQLLALGLTTLVLAVLWLGVVMPVIDWHGERADALEQKAALVQRMEALGAMRAGVQLNSGETLPGDETGAYRRIRLRVSFNASWPVLMSLLKEFEIARPALLMDELSVQPALHRISTAPGTFDVSCAIFGFRADAAKGGTK